jgi:hypothetical protein
MFDFNQRKFSKAPPPIVDVPALFLGQRGIDVQHEGIGISAQLCHDEGSLVRPSLLPPSLLHYRQNTPDPQ